MSTIEEGELHRSQRALAGSGLAPKPQRALHPPLPRIRQRRTLRPVGINL